MKDYPIKIYIAGKITGNPQYRIEFSELKMQLLKSYPQAAILNPASLPAGMTAADYMRICFAMIDSADLVVFSHNAVQSKGAILERDYCRYTGKMYTTIQKDANVIVNCPACQRIPSIGYAEREYFLIDSDTRCPCCGEYSEIHRKQSDLINGWNTFSAVYRALNRKRADR